MEYDPSPIGVGLNKQKRLLNIGLIVIIIAMVAFVYFQVDRIIGFFTTSLVSSSEDPSYEATSISNNPTETASSEYPSNTLQDAPNFKLSDLNGVEVSLSQFQGKAVMMNFWAIWCPPCRAELPLIQEHADQYHDQLVVLAINAGEEKSDVQHFVEAFDYDLVFLLDQNNYASNLYQIRGLPTTVFVDEEGIWQATHIGELRKPLLSTYLRKVGITE